MTVAFLVLVAAFSTFCDTVSLRTGDYLLDYNQEAQWFSTLTIRRQSKPDRVLWATSDGRPVLSGIYINQTVAESSGHFNITQDELMVCQELEPYGLSPIVEKVSGQHYRIVLPARLCKICLCNVTFQADDVGSYQHLVVTTELSVQCPYNSVYLHWAVNPDDVIFGFGHQYTYFNLNGRRLPVLLQEQGVGRGEVPLTEFMNTIGHGGGGNWHTTYTQVPFYVTTSLQSFLLESPQYTVFDMTEKNHMAIEIFLNTNVTGRLISGDSYLDILASYTAYSGRMEPLPDWVSGGAVLGLQGGTSAVRGLLDDVKVATGNLDDVAAVWLQDWSGQRNFTVPQLPRVGLWWNWEVDTSHYPNWTSFVSDLSSQGVRVLTYINPLLVNVSRRGTPYKRNMFDEAMQSGYVVKSSKTGEPLIQYNSAVLINLTSPEAVAWLKKIIKEEMLGTGVSGWMCDFGESFPLQGDGNEVHSMYPYLWGQLNKEAIEESKSNSNDVVYFMRSGNFMTPKVTRLFWMGDQTVAWDEYDGLKSAVIGMLSGSASGFYLTHTDIGGYTAVKAAGIDYVRSKELLMRWCELAAFTAMYRSHLGTLPEKNWQFYDDSETMAQFFRMAKVFKAWAFYRVQLMSDAYEKGWPLMRHMIFNYPSAVPHTDDMPLQFMLGTELLVVPVTGAKLDEVRVFLPENTQWVHVWSQKNVMGYGTLLNGSAPIGYPYVLYPAGSTVGERFVENLKAEGLLYK